MSESLFAPLFVPDELRVALSATAWLQAMLDAERALALAEADAQVIPAEAAEAIAVCCDASRFDADAIAAESRGIGAPAEPLVRALRAAAGDAADYVHYGATSQDIVDTAAMLVAARALGRILEDVAAVAHACARLAEEHRSTPIAGRTLLQHAVPTTFGLKAAGWLVGVLDARRQLVRVRDERLAVQLGGAAGTLAPLGKAGPEVVRLFAARLGLSEPVLPWHTLRGRIAELAFALDETSGALAKIGRDLALLAQTEVGEVEAGAGGSSTMPHKRNPVEATLVAACATQVHALAWTLAGGLAQEHERAIGAWHAEWQPLSDALALTGGAASWARAALERVEVDAERMRANLDLTQGLVYAEAVSFALAGKIGRVQAQQLLREASARARDEGVSLRDALRADPRVTERLREEEIDALLDPSTALGSAEAFVDRALELYRDELGEDPARRSG